MCESVLLRPPIFHESVLKKVYSYRVRPEISTYRGRDIACSRMNLFFVILVQRKESAMVKPIVAHECINVLIRIPIHV